MRLSGRNFAIWNRANTGTFGITTSNLEKIAKNSPFKDRKIVQKKYKWPNKLD
jgi:hypothetical protein